MNAFAAGMKDLMKSEMEKERDKLQGVIVGLEARLAQATATPPRSSSSSSWESSYAKFDHLDVDTREEMEVQIDLARSNLIRLNEKMESKSCSHNHPCCCSQNRSAEIEVMSMTTSQRIEKMKEFKLNGNAFFQVNKSRAALEKYKLALIYYEYCFDAIGDEKRELEHVRLLCLLNAAACTLGLELYAQCIEFCNEALEIDDNNPKAFYRRGKAHRLLNRHDLARRDLEIANELSKGGKGCNDIRREIMLLQQCEEQYKQATLEFAQRAIGGPRKTDDNEKE
mmetsp:Transcript_18856/g.29548  ORF Transcript_18856/g.29548 Transcript_18856/m.29548 type:complete len:282 (-) Transcript_18856:6-851(-)